MKKPTLDKQNAEFVMRLINSGIKTGVIAHYIYGVSTKTIRNNLKKHNIIKKGKVWLVKA